MPDQRIVGTGAVRGGTGAVRGAGVAPKVTVPEPEPVKKNRRWPFVAIAVVVVFVLAITIKTVSGDLSSLSGDSSGTEQVQTAKLGEIVAVDTVSVNLADGHYLRVGLSMQMSDQAEEVSTAVATDAIIELFSGQKIESINDEETRLELKSQLLSKLNELFEGQVLDIYFTDFVTQ